MTAALPACAALSDMGPGFADPVHGAQQTFRALLDAMARPGRVVELPSPALRGLLAPPPLTGSLGAVLLTLLDAETSLALEGRLADAGVRAWLRFHCGVREVAWPDAAFAAVDAADADAALWFRLDAGSDEAPQCGATLIVAVPQLQADPARSGLALRGPGVRDTHRLGVPALPAAFWHARDALAALAPRGVDLVLVGERALAAIPRSTAVTVEH